MKLFTIRKESLKRVPFKVMRIQAKIDCQLAGWSKSASLRRWIFNCKSRCVYTNSFSKKTWREWDVTILGASVLCAERISPLIVGEPLAQKPKFIIVARSDNGGPAACVRCDGAIPAAVRQANRQSTDKLVDEMEAQS